MVVAPQILLPFSDLVKSSDWLKVNSLGDPIKFLPENSLSKNGAIITFWQVVIIPYHSSALQRHFLQVLFRMNLVSRGCISDDGVEIDLLVTVVDAPLENTREEFDLHILFAFFSLISKLDLEASLFHSAKL